MAKEGDTNRKSLNPGIWCEVQHRICQMHKEKESEERPQVVWPMYCPKCYTDRKLLLTAQD